MIFRATFLLAFFLAGQRFADSQSGHSVTLRWNYTSLEQSPEPTGFGIFRGPAAFGPFHEIATVGLKVREYVDTTVEVRKALYCYEVMAGGGGAETSGPSNVQCVTIP
jgi:hypothetical protein